MATPLGTAAQGTVILDEPNPTGRGRALLARDQNHMGRGEIAMRNRALVPVEPEGGKKATSDNAVMMDPSTIGLSMRPIMVQRGEGAPLLPADTDGTVAGMERMNAAIRNNAAEPLQLSNLPPQTPEAEVMALAGTPPPTEPSPAPGVPAAPILGQRTAPRNKRVRWTSKAGGRLTLFCRDVVVSAKVVVLVFPMDGSTAIVEPPVGDSIDIEVDGAPVVSCVSNDMTFERGSELFLVLLRLPG
jgi:hypothetical protein